MIKLSGYKILKKIGSGGMGDVYLAEHEKLEKKVAIKSLHKNLATNSDFRKRFLKEAKTHSMLSHANIVGLLDYKERKDGLFLIMEYVEGMQLDQHIKNVSGPIPKEDLIKLFNQILDAIGYAHKKGLIHRDIKPSNIMLTKDNEIKVLDFGIAKLQDDDKELTKTGVQVGTASYMSPEQVNAKKVDKLTDVYSLGVTLYYMAVGKSPYSDDTNTFSIQTKIIGEPLPSASEIYPGVTKGLEEIITKATEKNKKERYQDCKEFKHALNIGFNHGALKPKKNSSFLLRAISILLFILVIYLGYELSLGHELSLDLKETVKETERKLKKSKSTISDLKEDLSAVKEDLSGVNYKSGCSKRSRIYYQSKTWKSDLNFVVSYKKDNGEWSEWGSWSKSFGTQEKYHLLKNDDEVLTTDYRYYVQKDNYQNYLYSEDAPGLTSTCITPTLYIY